MGCEVNVTSSFNVIEGCYGYEGCGISTNIEVSLVKRDTVRGRVSTIFLYNCVQTQKK